MHLKKFNISQIRPHSSIGIIGKRGSGKTMLTKDILYKLNNLSFGLTFSPTEPVDHNYKTIFSSSMFAYDTHNDNILENFIKRQNHVAKNTQYNPNSFLVFDQTAAFQKETKTLYKLHHTHRHYHTTLISCLQYAKQSGPIIRDNFDYVFIFKDISVKGQKELYDSYCYGLFQSFSQFQSLLSTLSNYECLVIDKLHTTKPPAERVFWYKADTHIPVVPIDKMDDIIYKKNETQEVEKEQENKKESDKENDENLIKENEKLKKDIIIIKEDNDKLNKDIESLKNINDTLTSQNEQFKKQIADMSDESIELMNKNKSLTNTNDYLKKLSDEGIALMRKNEELMKENNRLKKENTEIKKENDSLNDLLKKDYDEVNIE